MHRRLLRFTTDGDAPLRQGVYQSELRDERVAAVLGAALGILFTTCFVTGLYSHLHQHPLSWLPVPSRPAGLFRVTQGIHVAAGIASIPVVVAKLWVVWPRFVSFPPAKRLGDVVERIGLFPLVGGAIFMVFSGVANIAQWYPWRFGFPAAHFWMAWVTMGAIVAHLGAKWAIAGRSLRRSPRQAAPAGFRGTAPAGTAAAGARPVGGLSRRGFLGTVGATSAVLTVFTVGQTFRPLRRLAVLAPRDPERGPQGRPVNRSASNAGVGDAIASPDWRLTVDGKVAQTLSLTHDDVVRLAVHEATLPIACVEGWSYSARWRGIRMVDLLAMAGAPSGATVRVESLEAGSPYRTSFLDHAQAHDRDTLLATHLDGQLLHPDHGFPLRLIGPGRPGVAQTKWITKVVVL